MNHPEYSQVVPIDVRGPSTTLTPMVRLSGWNVNPDCRVEKEPLKETEQQDWQNKLKNIASDMYAKWSKDLLDEGMAEMTWWHDLESLRP